MFLAWIAKNYSGIFSSYLITFFSSFWDSSLAISSLKSFAFLVSYSDFLVRSIILFSFFFSASLLSAVSFFLFSNSFSSFLLLSVNYTFTALTASISFFNFSCSVFKPSLFWLLTWVNSFFLLFIFSLISAMRWRRVVLAVYWALDCSYFCFWELDKFCWAAFLAFVSSAILRAISYFLANFSWCYLWRFDSLYCYLWSVAFDWETAVSCSCLFFSLAILWAYAYASNLLFSCWILYSSLWWASACCLFFSFKFLNSASQELICCSKAVLFWISFSSSSCLSFELFCAIIFSLRAFYSSDFLLDNSVKLAWSVWAFSSYLWIILLVVSIFVLEICGEALLRLDCIEWDLLVWG